jgi:rubrerythrin
MGIIAILEGAIKAERNAREEYLKLAGEATDPETRAVLEQLARDEMEHENTLKERLEAVKLMNELRGM